MILTPLPESGTCRLLSTGGDSQNETRLLRLFVPDVLTAASAIFPELETLRGLLLVLGRHVVTLFAFRAL